MILTQNTAVIHARGDAVSGELVQGAGLQGPLVQLVPVIHLRSEGQAGHVHQHRALIQRSGVVHLRSLNDDSEARATVTQNSSVNHERDVSTDSFVRQSITQRIGVVHPRSIGASSVKWTSGEYVRNQDDTTPFAIEDRANADIKTIDTTPQGDMFLGGSLSLDGDGIFQTNTTGYRAVMANRGYPFRFFYSQLPALIHTYSAQSDSAATRSVTLSTGGYSHMFVAIMATTSPRSGVITNGIWEYILSDLHVGAYYLTVATQTRQTNVGGAVTATQLTAGPFSFVVHEYSTLSTPMLDRTVPHLLLTGVDTARITDTAITRGDEAALAIVVTGATTQLPSNSANANLLSVAAARGEWPPNPYFPTTGGTTFEDGVVEGNPGKTQVLFAGAGDAMQTPGALVVEGTAYCASAYIQAGGSVGDFKLGIRWWDDNDSVISTSYSSTQTLVMFSTTRYSMTATAPSNARYCAIIIEDIDSGTLWVNHMQLERGSSATTYVEPVDAGLRPWETRESLVTAGTNPLRLGVYERIFTDPELLDFKVDFGAATNAIVAMLSWEGPDNRFAVTEEGRVIATHLSETTFVSDEDTDIGSLGRFTLDGQDVVGLNLISAERSQFYTQVLDFEGVTEGAFITDGHDWRLRVTGPGHLYSQLSARPGDELIAVGYRPGVIRVEGGLSWDPDDDIIAFGGALDIQALDGGDEEFPDGTPDVGYVRLFSKLDGGVARLFTMDSDGTEYGPY